MEAIFPFLFSFPSFPPLLVFLFPVSSSLPTFSPFIILFSYSLYPSPLFFVAYLSPFILYLLFLLLHIFSLFTTSFSPPRHEADSHLPVPLFSPSWYRHKRGNSILPSLPPLLQTQARRGRTGVKLPCNPLPLLPRGGMATGTSKREIHPLFPL